MTPEELRGSVQTFIQQNFLFDQNKTVDHEQSLLATGIVDSTGILELISFLEESCRVKFADHELTADNFDSVGKIVSFVSQKLSGGRDN
jgi:acyl carrier protein